MLKTVSVMTLLFFVTGCASAVNDSAVCDGTELLRTEHAAGLYEDGGNLSVITGTRLIMTIDAVCK